MSQILNLLNLAPDLQEELLILARPDARREPITERHLRGIVAEVDWGKKRRMWGDSQQSLRRASR